MANVNITSPQDTDFASQFPSDERNSRTATVQLANGDAWWGGTSGGSADAQTVTVDHSDFALAATDHPRVTFIAGFTNLGAMTLNANGLGDTAVVTRSGAALSGGEVQLDQLHEVLFDGTSWRLLDSALAASGGMAQGLYDVLLPVGFVQLRWDGTAPTVPAGITATWTAITDTDRYLRINNAGGGGTAGSANTGSHVLTESEMPAHHHKMFDDVDGSSQVGINEVPAVRDTSGGDNNYIIDGSGGGPAVATHGETGNTGGGAGHTHTCAPLARDVRAYRRSA